MAKRITIVDVAQVAGVSTATVGRVMNQRGYVSDDARARVEKALRQTGFQVNIVAQSLRQRRTRVIGHIVTGLVPNPFFANVELGVEETAVEEGYSVLVWNSLSDADREREGVQAFIQRRIDGIIFTTPRDKANVQLALDAGIKVVQVERPTFLKTDVVKVDNYVGSASAVEHLIELGHRRIAYVGTIVDKKSNSNRQINHVVDHERFNGYRDKLRDHDIPIDPSLTCLDVSAYSIEDGARTMLQLLNVRPRITAVLASCDILAAGILQTLYEAGLRVPQDVSVIGFDDTYARFLTPPLTTVEVNTIKLGRAAARLAIAHLESDDAQATTEVVESRLIIRKSTGRVP